MRVHRGQYRRVRVMAGGIVYLRCLLLSIDAGWTSSKIRLTRARIRNPSRTISIENLSQQQSTLQYIGTESGRRNRNQRSAVQRYQLQRKAERPRASNSCYQRHHTGLRVPDSRSSQPGEPPRLSLLFGTFGSGHKRVLECWPEMA